MTTKRIVTTLAMAGVVTAALGRGIELRASSAQNEHGLAGSWEIRITQPDLSPLPFGLDFRVLRSVTTDSIVDANAFPGFGPAGPQLGLVVNSGHGSWSKAGPRQYTAMVKSFQLDQAAFPFVLHSIATTTEEISMSADGDSYTSQITTQVHRADGTLIFTNQGGAIATRIK